MASLSDGLQPLEGMQFISETTVSSSVSAVDIISGIDSTFDVYIIIGESIQIDLDGSAIELRFFTSGTVDSTSSYLRASPSTGENSTTQTSISVLFGIDTATQSNGRSNFTAKVYNPSTLEYTMVSSNGVTVGDDSGSPAANAILTGGVFAKTDSVDGVRIFESNGNNFTAGTFRLYGIKN